MVSTSPLEVLITRGITPTNGTTPLQVVCAWPLSGQYGPFLRFIYYFFVAGCVTARKKEWLENALVVPAVSALHGLALAALHVDSELFMPIVFIYLVALSSRCRRYGYLWGSTNVRGRDFGRSSNSQAIEYIPACLWSEYCLPMDRPYFKR